MNRAGNYKTNYVSYLFTDVFGNKDTENKKLDEFIAVVLKDYKSGDITKNPLRKEHGLWLRAAY